MRISAKRPDRALVIGLYQSPETTGTALTKLRHEGFRKAAAVHSAANGEVRIDEHGISEGRGVLASALIGLLFGILLLVPPKVLEHPEAILGLALSLGACAVAGGLAGWWLFRSWDTRVDRAH